NMADFDPVILEKIVHEVMVQLLTPIIGETKLDITLESDRVKVFIDDEENSGLIIGREGQTLSSIQYLVNRLVSRKMEASVRIQVDTGDYRERQDDKLRQVAWHLAEKAGSMGRTQSTKPLSSYHRRVVHLALQDNEDVFTRSKGDGPMKRVLIVPKTRKSGNRSSRD
ncbi:MAG: KH domain-containing protein, partial [Proteobacteria bacterium]|nr:KH domain-containing protein [Pseudomonadota bacterium]